MQKLLIAFGLGVVSFFLFMVVGETMSLFAALLVVALYFAICQFLFSRGKADAYRKDWPVMLALEVPVFAEAIIIALVEKRAVFLSQGLGLLLSSCGGTYVGALVASLTARRKSM